MPVLKPVTTPLALPSGYRPITIPLPQRDSLCLKKIVLF
jgi:hypothetical protein